MDYYLCVTPAILLMLPAMSANLEKLYIKDIHTNAVFEITINIRSTRIVFKINVRLEYNKMFNLL